MAWEFTKSPVSITSDVSAGSVTVSVFEGKVFRVDDRVKISDSSNWEWNYITNISGNTLFLGEPTENAYYVANGAKVQVDIILYSNPLSVSGKTVADAKFFRSTGGRPFIMSYGLKPDELRIEGTLSHPDFAMDELEIWYYKPLRALSHRKVTLSADDTRYDGEWLVESFKPIEKGGVVRSIRYQMNLWKGSSYHVVDPAT